MSIDLDSRPHALYRFFDAADALLYIGITANLPSRLTGHESDKPWWRDVARVAVEWLPDRGAVLAAERAAIIAERPRHNVQHNGGTPRPPIFAKPFRRDNLGPGLEPFDYEQLISWGSDIGRPVDEFVFPRFREALNDFANLGFVDMREYVEVVTDLALSVQYVDCCDCRAGRIPHGTLRAENPTCRSWPFRMEMRSGGFKCWYHCACCGNAWTCWFARREQDRP